MDMDEGAVLREALSAINQGDKRRARDLLSRLLKASPESIDTWLWMSSVVETRRERVYCLKEVLKRDPGNRVAQRGMVILGAAPGDEHAGVPYDLQRRNWEAGMKRFSTFDTIIMSGAWRPVVIVLGLLVVAALIVGGYSLTHRTDKTDEDVLIISNNTPEITLMVSDNELATPTMIQLKRLGSATPLSSFLLTPYTPTPLYVNTLHPKTEDYRNAIFAHNRGDWLAVIESMNNVLEVEPGSMDAWYYIGEANRFLGKNSEAVNAYNRALDLNSQFAPAYLGRARVRLAESFTRNWKSARGDLEKAIQYDPLMGEAYLEIGLLDLQRDEAELAIESFKKAEKYLSDSPLLQKGYARALLASGEVGEAIVRARKAIQLDLTDTNSYRILAEAHLLQGNMKLALEPLQIYTLYHPEDLQAWTWLGQALAGTGNVEGALETFAHVLTEDARNFDALISRGQVYLNAGKAEEAALDFRTALGLKGDSFEANLGLGQASLVLRNYRDASYYTERARAYAGSDDAKLAAYYFYHAQALEGLLLVDSARRDWNNLLALPEEVIPAEWAAFANDHLMILNGEMTTTPEPQSPTVEGQAEGTPGEPANPLTPEVTPSDTRMPTMTVSPTQTRMPTATPILPTVTQTRQPTITATVKP